MQTLPYILVVSILTLGAAEDVMGAISGPDYATLAAAQRAEGNTSERLSTYFLDIMNATPDLMPKISTGTYDSIKYTIPVGPYHVSFQMRSPLNIVGVGYITFNDTAGSGTTYHLNEYEEYWLSMEEYDFKNVRSNRTFDLWITHYIGPAKYLPIYIDRGTVGVIHIPKNWEYATESDVTIDGHQGHEQSWDNKRFYWVGCIDEYNMDPSTYITIEQSRGNWEKDGALAIETMHITKSVE